MKIIFFGTILFFLANLTLDAQLITNNPPSNSFQDSYSTGSYTRCAYNVNISETHLSSDVNYITKAGQSVRIQASSGGTPYSNIGNFSAGSFHAFVDPNYNLSGCGLAGSIIWDNYFTGDGSILREVKPVDYQLYPRNSNNKGTVVFSGTDNGNNGSITFVTSKTDFNNVVSSVNMTSVNIINNRFSFSIQINAELSEYTFAYFLNGNPSNSFVTLAQHVVCGDAYLISGQSNASSLDLTQTEIDNLNNTYGASTSYGKYSRSLGGMWYRTNWGVSKVGGDLMSHVGAWGLPMQYKIQQTYGIPTCIINGAIGGTSIEQHVTPQNEPFYNPITFPNVSYDQKLFATLSTRVYNAGLENDIKGIFWWQGDAGGDVSYNYINHFTPLYNLWTTYIPNFKRSYIVQIPSWIENDVGVRIRSEYQRQMNIAFPNTTVMSANGIGYHRDDKPENSCGRHIDPVTGSLIGNEIHHQSQGYIELCNRLFGLLEKDVYGKTTNINDLTPPNIISASISGTQVTLRFDQNIYVNTIYGENFSNILEMIKFNSEISSAYSNSINKTNPVITGQELSFDIPSAGGITSVSYAGFLQNKDCVIDADFACYLRNSKNIAALSFYNFPVAVSRNLKTSSEQITVNSEIKYLDNTIQVYPNPFNKELTVIVNNKEPVNSIIITDIMGRTVFNVENNLKQFTFDLSALKAGVYFIFAEANCKIESSKLIKFDN